MCESIDVIDINAGEGPGAWLYSDWDGIHVEFPKYFGIERNSCQHTSEACIDQMREICHLSSIMTTVL